MDYLTIGDAAEIAKMSTRTVRRAISRGEIPCYRVGGGLRLLLTVQRGNGITLIENMKMEVREVQS